MTIKPTLTRFTALLLVPLAALHAAPLAADTPTQKPNVLFILADDLGWGDLRCYGNSIIDTPVLDSLAQGRRSVFGRRIRNVNK